MTVGELISKLRELNPEHIVVVDGYEGGVTEVREISTVRIAKHPFGDDEIYGALDIVDPTQEDFEDYYDKSTLTTAVYLPRCPEQSRDRL